MEKWKIMSPLERELFMKNVYKTWRGDKELEESIKAKSKLSWERLDRYVQIQFAALLGEP